MHFSLDTILLELRGVASSIAALKVAIYHRPRSNTLGKRKLQVKNTILTTSITAAHMGVLGEKEVKLQVQGWGRFNQHAQCNYCTMMRRCGSPLLSISAPPDHQTIYIVRAPASNYVHFFWVRGGNVECYHQLHKGALRCPDRCRDADSAFQPYTAFLPRMPQATNLKDHQNHLHQPKQYSRQMKYSKKSNVQHRSQLAYNKRCCWRPRWLVGQVRLSAPPG